MLLSIIVPTYRRPVALAALLVDLGDQIDALGDGETELVVVDNCPDRSAELMVADQAPGRSMSASRALGSHMPATQASAGRKGAIIFIDDDQRPVAGWLESYRAFALLGHAACFGPVKPTFEAAPPAALRPLLEGLFSRDAKVPTGTESPTSGPIWALATRCLNARGALCARAPFDLRFNHGGEDVWFLRELVQDRGLRLIWSAEAAVHETVPAARMTAAYVRQRRFRNGQLRCLVEAGGRNWGATAFWMAAGLAQTVIFGAGALIALLVARPRAAAFGGRAAGGLGKVLWWVRTKA